MASRNLLTGTASAHWPEVTAHWTAPNSPPLVTIMTIIDKRSISPRPVSGCLSCLSLPLHLPILCPSSRTRPAVLRCLQLLLLAYYTIAHDSACVWLGSPSNSNYWHGNSIRLTIAKTHSSFFYSVKHILRLVFDTNIIIKHADVGSTT